MSDVNPSPTDSYVPTAKTSTLAIISAVCGILGLILNMLLYDLGGLLLFVALITGIIALVKISKSNGRLKGKVWAIIGIVSIFFGICTITVLTLLGPSL